MTIIDDPTRVVGVAPLAAAPVSAPPADEVIDAEVVEMLPMKQLVMGDDPSDPTYYTGGITNPGTVEHAPQLTQPVLDTDISGSGGLLGGLIGGHTNLIQGIFDGIAQGIGSLFTSGNGVGTVATNIGVLNNGVNLAQAQAAQAKAALAGILAAQQAAASGGNTATDNFHRADSPTLGTSWSQYYAGGTGTLRISSNVAHWALGSNVNTSCLAFWNGETFATDYQSVHMTLSGNFSFGTSSGATTSVWCWCRGDGSRNSDTTYTQLPYNAIMAGVTGDGHILLACVVNGTMTTLATYTHGLNSGDTIELRAGTLSGPQIYTVLLNGTPVISYTDTTHGTLYGAGYRQAGIRFVSGTAAFSGVQPPEMVEFDLADIVGGVGYTGYGWSLYRANTSTAVTMSAGSAMPASFYDTSEIGPNVVLSNLGTGQVVAPKSGWYTCTMGIMFPTIAIPTTGTAVWTCRLGAIVGGTLVASGGTTHFHGNGNAVQNITNIEVAATFQFYAVANQIIAPAVVTMTATNTGGGSVQVNGDAAGAQCYFTGQLTTPSA